MEGKRRKTLGIAPQVRILVPAELVDVTEFPIDVLFAK